MSAYWRCVLVLAGAGAVELSVRGDVSIELRAGGGAGRATRLPMQLKDNKLKLELGGGSAAAGGGVHTPSASVTAAPVVECVYQYPERRQLDAVLSNMMNMLTKVFVRTQRYLRLAEEAAPRRRAQRTRFKVIDQNQLTFFDHIYLNMTREYREFYNRTASRVYRAQGEGAAGELDPCRNQEQIKQLWKELIDSSAAGLRRAAARTIAQYLRARHRAHDRRARAKVEEFLIKELSKIKAQHLSLLCDNFQLCYNELL